MVPYLHEFSASFCSISDIFALYIWCQCSIIIKQIDAKTIPFNGAIWDEFADQRQDQKHHIY